MATKGFIELLRLADRGKRGKADQIDKTQRWSGVTFEMFGKYFVAPLGDVGEVIYVPDWTPLPYSQPWLCGVANLRGRLFSIASLPAFIEGGKIELKPTSKVLCLVEPEFDYGVVVDQVFGIQHFDVRSYFKSAAGLSDKLAQFCQGHFMYQGKPWHVFMLRDLLNNPRFMNSSRQ